MTRKRPGAIAGSPARPLRQPTQTLFVGLLLLVFMCVVWSLFTGIRLPTFFQRLAGLVNALLAMLVVMFAIREYGKRYNRLPLPWFGRVSTSRIAGGIAFAAVFAWWLSPWAPIRAGAAEPDLLRLLEQGLDVPMLGLIDTGLATFDPPTPSTAAREAAAVLGVSDDPLRRALVAIARGQFTEAAAFLDQAEHSHAAGERELQLLRAQLDCYAARYDSASRRYGELLKSQPMFEDFLAHGALAAALAGDYDTANRRAQQLLEQASVRARESVRLRQAVNLMVGLHVLQGQFAAAALVNEQTRASRERATRAGDWEVFDDPQLAANVNNTAVLSLLAPMAVNSANAPTNALSVKPAVGAAPLSANRSAAVESPTDTSPIASHSVSPTASLVLAKRLWLDWNWRHGQSREQPDLRVALVIHNLAMVALKSSRFDQAESFFDQERQVREQVAAGRNDAGLGINQIGSAQLARIEAKYKEAAACLDRATDRLATLPPADPNRLAIVAVRAQLDADLGQTDRAAQALDDVVQRARTTLARDHRYVAVNSLRLAEVRLTQHQDAEAQSLANQAEKILGGATVGQPISAKAARIAGLAALGQGNRDLAERRLDQAERILFPADESLRGLPPAAFEGAALAAARGDLAVVLETFSAAQDSYAQALRIIDEIFGKAAAEHPLRAEYLLLQARLQIKQGKLADAIAGLEAALAIREKVLPPSAPATIETVEELAALLAKAGRSDESKARAEQAKALKDAATAPSQKP